MDHCGNSVNINFTLNLTQGVFIDRIYRINHTETWNFNAITLVTSVSHKITAKFGILCPKTLLLTEKQLHAIQFFVATSNVCPLAIPKSCAHNTSIWLLENHSFQAAMHHTTPSYMRGISLGIFYWEAFDSGEFVLLSSPTPGGTVNFPVHLQSPRLDWGLTPGGSKWKNRDRVWGLKKIVKAWLPQYSRLPRY